MSLTPAQPWDVPDKNFMQGAFVCCFRQGMAVIWVGTSRGSEELDARKLWADFGSLDIIREPEPMLLHPSCVLKWLMLL